MQAVRLLEKRRLKNDAEEQKWKSILIKLYLNLSLCNLRLRKPILSITHSRNALALDSNNVKAIFRLGQVKGTGECAMYTFMSGGNLATLSEILSTRCC